MAANNRYTIVPINSHRHPQQTIGACFHNRLRPHPVLMSCNSGGYQKSIVADRRLLYESERGSKPIKQQRKDRSGCYRVGALLSPPSPSISAEVYFYLI